MQRRVQARRPVAERERRSQANATLLTGRAQPLPEALKIPLRLRVHGSEVCGYTRDFTPEGLALILETPLRAGTPLALQCSFEEVCHLQLSGSVVSCDPLGSGRYASAIKFSGVREWERRILTSAVQELNENASAQEKSLLTVRISQDDVALEAAALSRANGGAVKNGASAEAGDPPFSSESLAKQKRVSPKRAGKFTADPSWVIEMNQYLEPYKQAIWQTKLVQETSTGQLSLRQVRGWSIQFYPFIEHFPQFMATYLAKATDPMSRAFLIDNLRVEKRHADQWIDMARGFGVAREELFATPIVPQVEALTHWLWSISSRGTFVEAVSATNYAIEGVTQGIATIMVRGFDKYHGKDGVFLDRRAYYWMEAHSSYDDLHPLEALEVIKLHAKSTDLQMKVRHAAQRSLEYLFGALEACYWAYAPEHVCA